MTDVRERLAEVLDVWEVFTSGDGLRSIRARTAEELADAILSDSELVDALVRSRLEQVGRRCHICRSFRVNQDCGVCGATCEPVYRIKGEAT